MYVNTYTTSDMIPLKKIAHERLRLEDSLNISRTVSRNKKREAAARSNSGYECKYQPVLVGTAISKPNNYIFKEPIWECLDYMTKFLNIHGSGIIVVTVSLGMIEAIRR